jgi:hypothetical protein
MKGMLRRLRQIEERLAPKNDVASQAVADLIRERRRRRLQAQGLPYEERSDQTIPPSGRCLSVAETLRLGRRLRRERATAQPPE